MSGYTNGELHFLRHGRAISPEQYQTVCRILRELAYRVPAYFAFVADVSGQVVEAVGDYEDDNLVLLGSLVAGDLAAGQEVARLTGQTGENQITFREGVDRHTFIAAAGPDLLLFVQTTQAVPMGWTRMLILSTVEKLSEIIATTVLVDDELPDLSSQAELGDLFDQELDALWLE